MPKRPRPDAKTTVLRQHGCLHRRPETVRDPLFSEKSFFDPRDVVQVKYEMVRRVEIDAQGASAAAKSFGFSRPAFYQARASFTKEGLPGLLPKKRGPREGHKLTEGVVTFAAKAREDDSTLSPHELAEKIREGFGVTVHPRSVQRALERRGKKGR